MFIVLGWEFFRQRSADIIAAFSRGNSIVQALNQSFAGFFRVFLKQEMHSLCIEEVAYTYRSSKGHHRANNSNEHDQFHGGRFDRNGSCLDAAVNDASV